MWLQFGRSVAAGVRIAELHVQVHVCLELYPPPAAPRPRPASPGAMRTSPART